MIEMKVDEIIKTVGGKMLCGEDCNVEVSKAFSSDLMSDVLTIQTEGTLLITGLANLQAIRTAEMSDINCIVFARNKRVTEEMVKLAKENDIVLIQTPCSVFKTSGELYKAGIEPLF